MIKKGIILAGGSGTRLYPVSKFVCKQLLPAYDKPLIYYSITTMILSGVKEILIISTAKDIPYMQNALGDGSAYGINLEYAVQKNPNGIAEAFIIGEEFINGDPCILLLGDNIFHRSGFSDLMQQAVTSNTGATIFGFPVAEPQRYGVIELAGDTNHVVSIEEKPKTPKSNLAAVGLYIYDSSVVEKAKSLKPSARGELEITDINSLYLQEGRLNCLRFSRGDFWIDVGRFDALNDASNLIRLNEHYTGKKIGCPEEASLFMGNLTPEQLSENIKHMPQNSYVEYLSSIVRERLTSSPSHSYVEYLKGMAYVDD